jgi:hypothetical protein
VRRGEAALSSGCKAHPAAPAGSNRSSQREGAEHTGILLAAGLGEQQSNFAGKPWRVPIKPHLTPELASNYVFYNVGAAPAVRGGRRGRPASLGPAQTELSVCRRRPYDFNVTIRCR